MTQINRTHSAPRSVTRAADMTGTAVGATGNPDGAAGGGKPKRQRRRPFSVIGMLGFTLDQFTVATNGFFEVVDKVGKALQPIIPSQFWEDISFHGARYDSPDFINDMATLQDTFGPDLGRLRTKPVEMRQMAGLASAADKLLKPAQLTVTALLNIRNYCLSSGTRDARIIYRRAKILAEDHADIADAIARYRVPNIRAGEKSAQTRKLNQQGQPAPEPATTTEDPALTTTTTTISTKK